MLHKDHISGIQIYTDEWFQARLGRFTSSRINAIMTGKDDNALSEGGFTYIYHKVGEELTGQTTAEDEVIEDENTAWGLQYEPELLKNFADKMKIEFMVTQKMITNPEKRFSSTPDGIWIRSLCENQYEYNVATVEGKCPRKYHKFIPLYECKTPADVYSVSRVYYWQVMDQMDNCGSAVGYFVVYHPLFPKKCNMNIVEFRKMDLWDDFRKLQARKRLAVETFERVRSRFIDE